MAELLFIKWVDCNTEQGSVCKTEFFTMDELWKQRIKEIELLAIKKTDVFIGDTGIIQFTTVSELVKELNGLNKLD